VSSYVWPDSYDPLESYSATSNDDIGYIYGGSSASTSPFNSGSDSGGAPQVENGDGLAPAYGLPGSPGIYSLSGTADTYILHGQEQDEAEKWPAVEHLDNHLTQGGQRLQYPCFFYQ
jgi:hypothetical protein